MDGEQIRRAREALGWTQTQLAEAVGVGMRTVGNWERGDTIPKNRMGALQRVLGHALDMPDPLAAYSELTLLNELMRRAVDRQQATSRPSE